MTPETQNQIPAAVVVIMPVGPEALPDAAPPGGPVLSPLPAGCTILPPGYEAPRFHILDGIIKLISILLLLGCIVMLGIELWDRWPKK